MSGPSTVGADAAPDPVVDAVLASLAERPRPVGGDARAGASLAAEVEALAAADAALRARLTGGPP